MFFGVAGMETVAWNLSLHSSKFNSDKSSKLERRGATRLCGLFRETTSQDRLRESKDKSLFILFHASQQTSIDCLFDQVADKVPLQILVLSPSAAVAAAIRKAPWIANKAQISAMGGSLWHGTNGTGPPRAEWNVRAEPGRPWGNGGDRLPENQMKKSYFFMILPYFTY